MKHGTQLKLLGTVCIVVGIVAVIRVHLPDVAEEILRGATGGVTMLTGFYMWHVSAVHS